MTWWLYETSVLTIKILPVAVSDTALWLKNVCWWFCRGMLFPILRAYYTGVGVSWCLDFSSNFTGQLPPSPASGVQRETDRGTETERERNRQKQIERNGETGTEIC